MKHMKKLFAGAILTAFMSLGIATLAACEEATDYKTISFETNGGSKVEPMQVEWGKELSSSEIAETTKLGYTFVSWCEDKSLTKPFTTKVVEEDFTLYAKWNVNKYKVSFYDGETRISGDTYKDRDYNYGSYISNLPSYSKSNFTFRGWYFNEGGRDIIVNPQDTLMPAHDVQLHALWEGNYYDVHFHKNGENVSGSMSTYRLIYGTQMTLPDNAFSRVGYTFNSWNTESDGTGTTYANQATLSSIAVSGTLDLYAMWDANDVTVTFYNNNALLNNLSTAMPKVHYDEVLEVPNEDPFIVNADGYHFEGWGLLEAYDEEELVLTNNYFIKTGDSPINIDLPTAREAFQNNSDLYIVKPLNNYVLKGDVTLYALYSRNQYSITFNSDGGTEVNPRTYYYDDNVTLPGVSDMSKAGHTFDAWKDDNNNIYASFNMPDANLELTAHWITHSNDLTLYPNNGQAYTSKKVSYGTLVKDEIASVSRDYYELDGWYFDNGTFVNELSDDYTMPDGAVSLYAKWNPYTLTATYNPNGGVEEEISHKYLFNDANRTILANSFTKAGYTFKGWNTKADGSGEEYLPGDSIDNDLFKKDSEAATLALFAEWEVNKVTVSYNPNDAEGEMAPHTYNYSDEDKTLDPNLFTKTGYHFTGWKDSDGNTYTKVDESLFTSTNETLELDAQWEANTVTVYYDANGGAGSMPSHTYSYNGNNNVLDPNLFTKTGYHFTNWKDALNNSYPANYVLENDLFLEEASSTLNLKAEWAKNEINVTFNSNYGASSSTVEKYYYDEEDQILPTNTFLRQGYSFEGWYLNPECTGDKVTKLSATDFATSSKNISLYAKWAEDYVDLTINVKVQNPNALDTYSDFNTYVISTYKTGDTVTNDDIRDIVNGFDIENYEYVSNIEAFAMPYNGKTLTINLDLVKHAVTFYNTDTEEYYSETFYVPHGTKIASNAGIDEFASKVGHSPRFNGEEGYTNIVITDDTTINITFEPVSYGLTVYGNGGTFVIDEKNVSSYGADVTYGDTFDSVVTPSRHGYTFDGWYFDQACTIKAETMDNVHNAIYAKWNYNTVNVTYHYNYGEEEVIVNDSVDYIDEDKSLAPIARDGYTFQGWNTAKDGSGETYTAVPDALFDDNNSLVLYAQWEVNKVKVSYVAGEGSGTMADHTYSYTGESQAIDNNTFTNDGHTFDGWKDGKGNSYTIIDNSLFTSLNGELTLIAQWKENTVTVIYVANGGTGEVDEHTYYYTDTNKDLNNGSALTKEGYTFSGWNTEADGKGTTYTSIPDSLFTSLNGELTLYAQWEVNKVTVSYNRNTGSGSNFSKTYNYADENKQVDAGSAFTKTGYTLVGWNTQADGKGTSYALNYVLENGLFTSTTGTLELYAVWAENKVTVSYDANGGTGEVAEHTYKYSDENKDLADGSELSREGYTFKGWNTKEDGTGTDYASIPNGLFVETDGALTLYAKWQENTLTVYYAANGGTGETYSKTYKFTDEDKALLDNEFERTYYTADGWKDADNNTVTELGNSLFSSVNGELILYVNWKANTVTIYFDSNQGSGEMPSVVISYDDVSKKILENTFPREYYKFANWNTEADGSGDTYVNNATLDDSMFLTSSELTLYAQWQVKTFIYRINGVDLLVVSNDETPEFKEYVRQVNAKAEAYNYIYEALEAAVNGNAKPLTGVVIYFLVGGNPDYTVGILMQKGFTQQEAVVAYQEMSVELAALPFNRFNDYQAQYAYIINDLVNNSGQKLSLFILYYQVYGNQTYFIGYLTNNGYDVATATYLYNDVNTGLSGMPLTEFTSYFSILAAASDMDSINVALVATSTYRKDLTNEYEYYENNAYNPSSSNPGEYFDGWGYSEQSEVVYVTPTYAHRLSDVTGFVPFRYNIVKTGETIISSDLRIDWNAVNDPELYGYEVTVIVGGNESNFVTPNNYIELTNVAEGSEVRITVTALYKNKPGEDLPYRYSTSEYRETKITDESEEVVVSPIRIASETAYFNYVNEEEEFEEGDLVVGDYYYLVKTSTTGGDLYLFTSGTIRFGNAEEIVSSDETLVSVDGNVINTNNKTGNLTLTITTNDSRVLTYNTHVNYYPDHIARGRSFNQYANNIGVSSNQDANPSDYNMLYLDRDGVKDSFKVGKATSEGAEYGDYKVGSRYNGVKLDFLAVANDGTTIPNNYFKYDVSVSPDTSYYYDQASNVIYFGEEGTYEVTIRPAANTETFTNFYVPNKVLKELNNDYIKTFTFEVNDGVNIYSDETLDEAYASKDVHNINILNNINAYVKPNMVPYVNYLVEHNLKGYVLEETQGSLKVYHGEVDIVDNTAYMKQSSTYNGPKYELIDENEVNPGDYTFKAFYLDNSIYKPDGIFRYISDEQITSSNADSIYYIERGARFVNNPVSGHFKILNETMSEGTNKIRSEYDLEAANIYFRSVCSPLTVNGNYFSVDAGEIPSIYSKYKVTAASSWTAQYAIQNVNVGIFVAAGRDVDLSDGNDSNVNFTNLTVYGNTSNTSKYASGSEQSIKDEMELRSGGINGIMSLPHTGYIKNADNTKEKADADGIKSGGYNYKIEETVGSQKVKRVTNTAKITLESVNIYDTVIGVHSDCYTDISYTRVDNSWANGIYCYGRGTDMVINIDHSYVGSSGGAAIHIEEYLYEYDPTVNIDYASTTINNLVSGEEPWFKGYGMEVMALYLKGNIEQLVNQLSSGYYTIIQEDSSTGVVTEKFDFAFFGRGYFNGSEAQYTTINGVYTNYADVGGFISSGGHTYFKFKMYQEAVGQYFYGFIEVVPAQ